MSAADAVDGAREQSLGRFVQKPAGIGGRRAVAGARERAFEQDAEPEARQDHVPLDMREIAAAEAGVMGDSDDQEGSTGEDDDDADADADDDDEGEAEDSGEDDDQDSGSSRIRSVLKRERLALDRANNRVIRCADFFDTVKELVEDRTSN